MSYLDSEADQLKRRSHVERRNIINKYDEGRCEGAEIDDWEDPKFERYHTMDHFGFIHDERLPDTREIKEKREKLLIQEVERSKKWNRMFESKDKYFGPKAKYKEKMINRIYKGTPYCIRGKLWYILLDIERYKSKFSGKYQEMLNLARRFSPEIRQIDLDINRTYRNHDMFRERYSIRQRALFSVLIAFSVYDTEVGYCQGMSQIAALLLLYLNEEEDAFWGLVQLMSHEKYNMHGFFVSGFPKLLRFQAHHDRLMKKYLHKLKKHLDKHSVETGIYTLKWFFQCFLDRIPFSLTIRVWDIFLLEGDRVMIAMALNILRMHRRFLLNLSMDELIHHLQVTLEKDFGFPDDHSIQRLREVMHELKSDNLDTAGRPTPEEFPQRVLGSITARELAEAELDAEVDGERLALTQAEVTLGHEAIQRVSENQSKAAIDEDELSLDRRRSASMGTTNYFDDTTTSIEDGTQSIDDCSQNERPFLDVFLERNGVSPSHSGSGVVRIHVSYVGEDEADAATSFPRYEGNKVFIKVNHHRTLGPSESQISRSNGPTPDLDEENEMKARHSFSSSLSRTWRRRHNHFRDVGDSSSFSSVETRCHETSSHHISSQNLNSSNSTFYMYDIPKKSQSIGTKPRTSYSREVKSYHNESLVDSPNGSAVPVLMSVSRLDSPSQRFTSPNSNNSQSDGHRFGSYKNETRYTANHFIRRQRNISSSPHK